MQNQGLIIGLVMIAGFFGLAGMSVYFVCNGSVEVDTLTQLYEGLGKVAAMFGIPTILAFFLASRGQTSGSIIESEPLKYETIIGTDTKE